MEDLYTILESSPNQTTEEIKKNYQRLALEVHPDKQVNCTDTQAMAECNDKFIQVNKAWKVLSDPEMRKEYDALWKQKSLLQEYPVQEDVTVDDFEFDDDNNEYVYSCRCGGEYIMTTTDVNFKMDLVCCGLCSLTVRVHYDDSVS